MTLTRRETQIIVSALRATKIIQTLYSALCDEEFLDAIPEMLALADKFEKQWSE